MQHDSPFLLNPPASLSLLESEESPMLTYRQAKGAESISSSFGSSRKTGPPMRQRQTLQTTKAVTTRIDQTKYAPTLDFQVIYVQDPGRHVPKQDKSRIKAHAMRQVHQRKRALKALPAGVSQRTRGLGWIQNQRPRIDHKQGPDPHNHACGSQSGTAPPSGQVCRGVTIVCVACGLSRLPENHDTEYFAIEYDGLPNAPKAESFDVFATSLAPITHRVHHLLTHYIEVVAPALNPPIYGATNKSVAALTLVDILRAVVSDEGCMHAIAADAAWELGARRLKNNQLPEASRSQMEGSFHFFEAVKLLQRRLESPKDVLSCSTIVTSCHLAGVATKAGKEQFAAHHNGIVKMVHLRGGIDTLPRQAAYHVSKGDGLMAWMRNKPPLLPLFRSEFYHDGKLTVEGTILVEQLRTSAIYGHHQAFLGKHLSVVEDCLETLTQLVELNSRAPNLVSAAMRQFGEDTYAKAQHDIVSFSIPSRRIQDPPHPNRRDAWRVAALIYLNSAIRKVPSRNLLQTMINRLVTSLQSSEIGSFWGSDARVLIWILFIGYVGSHGRPEQTWFVIQLRQLVNAEACQTLDELRQVLKTSLYRDSLFDSILEDLCAIHLQLP